MKEKLEAIEKVCNKLDEKMDTMNTTLVRNTVVLDEHVRRTNLLEGEVKAIKEVSLPPIQRHVVRITFLAKAIPWTLGALTAVLAIVWRLGLF